MKQAHFWDELQHTISENETFENNIATTTDENYPAATNLETTSEEGVPVSNRAADVSERSEASKEATNQTIPPTVNVPEQSNGQSILRKSLWQWKPMQQMIESKQ